jgi:hypothetical protein
MKKLTTILKWILLFAFIGSANATLINITETTDFMNSNGGGSDLGTFDLGINYVSGSVLRNSSAQSGFGDYADFWEAELLAGQKITAISVIISNIVNQSGYFLGAADNKVGGFGPFGAQAYLRAAGNGNKMLSATGGTSFPFFTNRYYFGATTYVGTDTGYSYQWQITVESISGTPTNGTPVPEPTSFVLFLAGLLALRMKLS